MKRDKPTPKFNLKSLTRTRSEFLVAGREQLLAIFVYARINTNWVVTDVKVSYAESGLNSLYVRLDIDNRNGLIFFDDFPEIERDIKALVSDAWNFSLGSGTLSNPRVNFVIG